MDDEREICQIELLCKQLYESTDATVRSEAEKALVVFQERPEALSKCQQLLERGDSPFSQTIATSTLTKFITKGSVTVQQRIDIRNYVLNYLATRPKLPSFVLQALVTLFARVTKFGWFDGVKDEYIFRNVISDVGQFLQGSAEHCMIGVQLLSQLTVEMNQISDTDVNRSLTKHRKIACSFRDTQLFDIFRLSCTLLSNTRDNSKILDFTDETQHGLMTQLLRLAHNCLTFDFIGTSTDESTDDLTTVQIPTSWRPAFLEFTTLKLFFDLYHVLPPTLACLALTCLVQIASIRRSLFNNSERGKFLTNLVNGVKQILRNPEGLGDRNSYHEFCRLLARLKSNYQLGELVMVENYPEAIELVAKFTIQSLQMWHFAPNSIHYLLSLWQRMVASVPYVKATEPHLLEKYAPEVTKAYITSRLQSVVVMIQEGQDDPLDDMNLVQQQLEQLSVIGRCEYSKVCTLLVELFDAAASRYQELITTQAQQIQISIQEGQMTWLVYIIGASIGGRVSFNCSDEHDTMDGELVCRVLQLMNLTDSGCEKLELAMLSFFEQFRKIYVGDQMQKNVKVYTRLADVLGLNDEGMVLSVFVRKIITNLKYWGQSQTITTKTLMLLSDLSLGYSCARKLLKLNEVQFLLNNHTSEHFPLLGNNVSISDMKSRSLFYLSLGRLLLVDLGEDEDRFHNFMLPLTAACESLGQLLSTSDSALFPVEDTKIALIGLTRDLRGLVSSLINKMAYMMMFDWIYPTYTQIFFRALELWYHDPQVTTPILKLFAELVNNKSQRLIFDVSSPNGILLFREASKMICSFAPRVLSIETDKDQIYPRKLKGMSICFSMLKLALCGGYVNFGVFRLYGDEALDNALNAFIKMLLSIQQHDLLDYPKISLSYYGLLECIAQDHMNFIATLEPHVFLYILSSISEGLTSLDQSVSSNCCATLDYIVTFIFKTLMHKVYPDKKRPIDQVNGEMFFKVLEMHPDILQQILNTVLNIIIYEDCRNRWAMSRPLLGLILLNEDYFAQIRENIIRSQPSDKQQLIATWFENLMMGVERNLLTKNRDQFIQNLSVFRRDLNEVLKSFGEIKATQNDVIMSQ